MVFFNELTLEKYNAIQTICYVRHFLKHFIWNMVFSMNLEKYDAIQNIYYFRVSVKSFI